MFAGPELPADFVYEKLQELVLRVPSTPEGVGWARRVVVNGAELPPSSKDARIEPPMDGKPAVLHLSEVPAVDSVICVCYYRGGVA